MEPTDAAVPAATVEVVYEAHSGCPTLEAFWSEMQRRSRNPLSLVSSGAEQQLRVTIVAAGGESRGTLVLEDDAEVSGARVFRDRQCSAVVSALAITGALAIERARAKRSTAQPAGAPPPPEQPAGDPGEVSRPETDRFPSRDDEQRLRVAAGLGIRTLVGLLPGPNLGWGVGAEIIPWSSNELVPSFRAGASFLRGIETPVGDLRGRVDLAHGTSEVCWPRWEPASFLSVGPCARGDIGALFVGGVSGSENVAVWGAAGAVGRVGWSVGTSVDIELGLGALVPVTRHRFVGPDGEVERELPWALLCAEVGAAFALSDR